MEPHMAERGGRWKRDGHLLPVPVGAQHRLVTGVDAAHVVSFLDFCQHPLEHVARHKWIIAVTILDMLSVLEHVARERWIIGVTILEVLPVLEPFRRVSTEVIQQPARAHQPYSHTTSFCIVCEQLT